MDEYEENETPEREESSTESESSEPEPEREESPSEPEPSEPEPEELEPEEPSLEPEAPEEPREPEPETPPSEESGSVDEADKVQDLIDAIGDLNQTITDSMTQEPEQLPAEGEGSGAGGGGGGEVQVTETSSVDLGPVVSVLERTNALLEQQIEIDTTQHNDLLQIQANVDFVFLAVAALIGVVIGGFLGLVFDRIWRG